MRFLRDRRGTTAIEYALIAGIILTGTIMALTTIGSDLSGMFQKVKF